MSTLTVKHYLEVAPASMDNNRGDLDRIVAALRTHTNIKKIECAFDLLGSISPLLRLSGGYITVTVEPDYDRLRIINIEQGNTTGDHFGLAVDLGTTVVAAELINLSTGKPIAGADELNGQIKYGEDLLTRLHFAAQGGVDALRKTIVATVNSLIDTICSNSGIMPSQITAASLAGNTSMTHLFLGLDPSPMRREPYAPVINHVPGLQAKELCLNIAPNAPVYIFPSAGSYLGGDLISGALASGIADNDETALLLDIGTNGEMILGNSSWLIAGAGAAGPALEGSVAECARRAEPGAIERVEINPDTMEPSLGVIGNKPAAGLCGSGLIDAIAQLYQNGLMDSTGRFTFDKKTDRWQKVDGKTVYVLSGLSNENVQSTTYVSEKDIQNVLRTKAAMVAALTILLDSVGLKMEDICRVYTAGSFGIHLSVDSATAIGLYPKLPKERFVSLGNGSLLGAREVLLNADKIAKAEQIADSITYIELNVHPAFMGIFRSAKYI